MSSVIFVVTEEDAASAMKLVRRSLHEKIRVICSFPPAFERLRAQGIHAIDSLTYFSDAGRSYEDFRTIVDESHVLSTVPEIAPRLTYGPYRFGDILHYSLAIYLAEVRHSMLLAHEILRKEQPKKIFVSGTFTESPMKLYQSGNFNCENMALFVLAKKRGIPVVVMNGHHAHNLYSTIQETSIRFIRSLAYSLKQMTAESKRVEASSIVFLANHYQLGNFIPVIKSFAKLRTPICTIGKADTALRKAIADHHIPFQDYSSQLPNNTSFSNLKVMLMLRYLFLWLRHRGILKRAFSKMGYWELVKYKLFYYYVVAFPQMIETLQVADCLFSQRPKVLFTTATNDAFSKCFALSAKRHGTSIIEVQHGLLLLDLDAPFRCNDVYAVWGKDVIPLLDHTSSKQHPHIVGYPYTVIKPSTPEQRHLSAMGRRALHISEKESVIVVLGAFPTAVSRLFSPVSTLGFINLLLDALSATNKQWTLVVRPHPSYDPSWITDIQPPRTIRLIVDQRKIPLDQLVAASDVVIANHTTTMLEALIQKKSLLLYLFLNPTILNRKLKSHPLLAGSVAPLFDTASQLTAQLNNMVMNRYSVPTQNVDAFLRGYFSLPGKITAARRLMDLYERYSEREKSILGVQ